MYVLYSTTVEEDVHGAFYGRSGMFLSEVRPL